MSAGREAAVGNELSISRNGAKYAKTVQSTRNYCWQAFDGTVRCSVRLVNRYFAEVDPPKETPRSLQSALLVWHEQGKLGEYLSSGDAQILTDRQTA